MGKLKNFQTNDKLSGAVWDFLVSHMATDEDKNKLK